MKLSEREKIYLKNKHKGGLNNEKGNKYENYFIVYKICHYLSQFDNIDKIYFSTQTEDFIDDLLINLDENFTYFQLKSTNKLTWGNGKKIKSLASDFYLQRKKSLIDNKKSNFRLVISNDDLRIKLNTSRPKSIKSVLEVLHFEYHEDLNSMIKKNNSFHDSLCKIMNIDAPSIDKLESLASTVYGAWGASTCKEVSIKEIFEKIKINQVSFIRSKDVLDISDELDQVLSNILGFRFIIENNFIKWTFKNTDSGILRFEIGSDEFQQIEQQILDIRPTNFTNLEEIITV